MSCKSGSFLCPQITEQFVTALLSKIRWLSVWFIKPLTVCCAIQETFYSFQHCTLSYRTCLCTHPVTHPHMHPHVHVLYMVLRWQISRFCHSFLFYLTVGRFVTTVVKQSASSLCPRSRYATVTHNHEFYQSYLISHTESPEKTKQLKHILL